MPNSSTSTYPTLFGLRFGCTVHLNDGIFRGCILFENFQIHLLYFIVVFLPYVVICPGVLPAVDH